MRNHWLNLVLSLTNRVYVRKQQLLKQRGFSAVLDVFILIFSEIFLAIVSLPLYLGVKPEITTAYLKDKGTYAQVTFDYNLRRILTLTGLGMVLTILALKLLLIIVVPPIYGPLHLYGVSDFQPLDITNRELIVNEISISTSKISKSIQRPVLDNVERSSNGNLLFNGTAKPGSDLVLLLSDLHASVYYGQADSNGKWQIEHSQQNFKLADGNHSILVYSYDKTSGLRSETSDERFVKITSTWMDILVRNVDVLVNWIIVLIVLLGVFLTFLTV